MSDLMTSIHLPGQPISGYADYGRKTVPDMIQLMRNRARNMKQEAEIILAAADEDFQIETYYGTYARRDLKVIREGRRRLKIQTG